MQAQVDTARLNPVQRQRSAGGAGAAQGGRPDSALIAAQQLVSDKQRDNATYEAKSPARAQRSLPSGSAIKRRYTARRDVESALAKVSALRTEINAMRATITAERERDQQRLDAARAALWSVRAE